jgi:hypothetical protein
MAFSNMSSYFMRRIGQWAYAYTLKLVGKIAGRSASYRWIEIVDFCVEKTDEQREGNLNRVISIAKVFAETGPAAQQSGLECIKKIYIVTKRRVAFATISTQGVFIIKATELESLEFMDNFGAILGGIAADRTNGNTSK